MGRLELAHDETVAERLCPRVLPTSPEKTPDWMPETRSGGS